MATFCGTIDMVTLSRPPPTPSLYVQTVSHRNGLQRWPPVKENLWWSIYNFHHHDINDGAADLHFVTGASFAFSGLLSVPMSMFGTRHRKLL
jgi:hypothetical protein